MKPKILNLTPHEIVLRTPEGVDIRIPPEPEPARVMQLEFEPHPILGVPVPAVPSPVFGEVVGLPAYREDTFLIVSGLVLAQCPRRFDVFAPATGPNDGAVRDAAGRIIAVTRLVAAPYSWRR